MCFNLKPVKKAQSVLEFCILTAVITAALLASTVYIKRSVQGRLRANSDGIGEQFSSVNRNSVEITSTDSVIEKKTYFYKLGKGGPFNSAITSETTTNEINTRSGYEEIGAGEALF